MDMVTLLVVLVILLAFTGLLVWSIANSRKQGQARAQLAQTLGLTGVEPDETLLAQITNCINRALDIYRLVQG